VPVARPFHNQKTRPDASRIPAPAHCWRLDEASWTRTAALTRENRPGAVLQVRPESVEAPAPERSALPEWRSLANRRLQQSGCASPDRLDPSCLIPRRGHPKPCPAWTPYPPSPVPFHDRHILNLDNYPHLLLPLTGRSRTPPRTGSCDPMRRTSVTLAAPQGTQHVLLALVRDRNRSRRTSAPRT
jgi:hypothetical protein